MTTPLWKTVLRSIRNNQADGRNIKHSNIWSSYTRAVPMCGKMIEIKFRLPCDNCKNTAFLSEKRPSICDKNAPISAKLTFPTHAMASDFARSWSRHSLSGHSISAGVAKVHTVDIYNITETDKAWISDYIKARACPMML